MLNGTKDKRQRVIIFARPEFFSQGLNAYFTISAQQPSQQVGTEFAVDVEVGGVDFLVIRNEDSYTVEET